jgi:hypothetical protein
LVFFLDDGGTTMVAPIYFSGDVFSCICATDGANNIVGFNIAYSTPHLASSPFSVSK